MAISKKPTPEPSQNSFSSALAEFAGLGNSDNMDMSMSTPTHTRPDVILPKKQRRRREESFMMDEDNFDDDSLYGGMYTPEAISLDDIAADMADIDAALEYDPDFDKYIEDAFIGGEDVGFRNSLISMGRKYAVKGMEDEAESSEVSKAFSRQERAVDQLIEEYQTATVSMQRDIELLRSARGARNYRTISDMMEVQATLMNGRLAAIKTQNDIAKNKFDINMKLSRSKSESAGVDNSATQAIQRIFSMGRGEIMSGIDDGVMDDTDYDYRPENTINSSKPVPPPVTDGEKFIHYENANVQVVIDYPMDDDGNDMDPQIYAIDGDGAVLTDYPLPTDPGNLRFNINEMTGEATDQLQRRYKVRRDGRDILED